MLLRTLRLLAPVFIAFSTLLFGTLTLVLAPYTPFLVFLKGLGYGICGLGFLVLFLGLGRRRDYLDPPAAAREGVARLLAKEPSFCPSHVLISVQGDAAVAADPKALQLALIRLGKEGYQGVICHISEIEANWVSTDPVVPRTTRNGRAKLNRSELVLVHRGESFSIPLFLSDAGIFTDEEVYRVRAQEATHWVTLLEAMRGQARRGT